MRAQASSIIACDLFTVESIGFKTLHVLFFIGLQTRRVLIGAVTDGPANLTWATQIARNLSEAREARTEPVRFIVHDRDKLFGPSFDEVFKAEGIEIIRTPWRAPRANAYAERWIRTARTECLDRVMVLGARHLHHLLSIYVEHYNRKRPHRGLDLQTPEGGPHLKPLNPEPSEIAPRPSRWAYPRVLQKGRLSLIGCSHVERQHRHHQRSLAMIAGARTLALWRLAATSSGLICVRPAARTPAD